MNAKIQTIRRFLVYALPVVVYFSNLPQIVIGTHPAMNLELTLPLVWLASFAVLSLPDCWKILKKSFKKSPRLTLLGLLFPAYLVLSIFWSKTPLRGLLTAGLVIGVLISILTLKTAAVNLKTIFKLIKKSGLIFALFCFIQSLLDMVGVSREVTLLCPGCTSEAFGFPHPNGLAIEPQFMGNLLIAPALIMLNSLLQNKSEKSQIETVRSKNLKLQQVWSVATTVFLIAMLFFTFSRGAIYGFIIGAIILVIGAHRQITKIIKGIIIIVSGFVLSLLIQGAATAVNPTNDTFLDGIARSINQLTLGKIDLSQTPTPPGEPFAEPPIETEPVKMTIFDGYIPESTNRRLELSSFAIQIATKNPTSFIFGVGIGGSGAAMLESFPEQGTAKEIVQNQYLESWLEL